MRKIPFSNDLYVVSDSVEQLKKAVDDGATIVQLRDKSSTSTTIVEKSRQILDYRKIRAFKFILNDDPDLAIELRVDGIHVGQDTDTRRTRERIGPHMILGKTTHSLQQAILAAEEGADYVSVGPVYATPTKPGRPAVGLAYVREAALGCKLPFVAIGGIDLTNIDDVLDAGARTVAVVRAWADAAELLQRIRARK
ncbi:MAG TPA: thiamine phosphate synthase [Syntrophorhabdaceae bacterium]|nr:thiamine phosphate synthase [Syntrophorhabdaceae bacterium]